MKKEWSGAANVFVVSMEISLENALSIVVYHLTRLIARQGDGTGFMDMLNDFQGPANKFIGFMGQQTTDKEAQTILTEDFESEFKDMSANLDNFDSLVRDIFPVNSTPYNLIMGRTRDRFYIGSYNQRIGALTGMANEMNDQGVPLGQTAVLAYRDSIVDKHTTQQTRMDKVGAGSINIDDLRNTLIKKLNKDRGWLLFNYGDGDDCQTQVNKFYPLNILGDRSVKGHYQLIVPKADFRKICIHLFTDLEMVDLVIGDEDVWISTAANANNPVASGYRAIAGTTVRVSPTVFGDLTLKYIIATSISLTGSSDVIFNIVKP